MNHDEALSEAVAGARVRPPHWQPGIYVEHSFSRGFLKCWPVDRPEDEPTRSSCDYRATAEDAAATWEAMPEPRPPVPIERPAPAIVAGWGKPLPAPAPEPIPEVAPKSVMTLKDGVWTKEPLTAPAEAPSKWGTATPKKEPGKWGI